MGKGLEEGLEAGLEEAAGSPEACDMGNIFRDLREEVRCGLPLYPQLVYQYGIFIVLSFGLVDSRSK
jgi:hypothetical protein